MVHESFTRTDRYTNGMRSPGHLALEFAGAESRAARTLSRLGSAPGETTPLRRGERVYFITVEGEFPATVTKDWGPALPIADVVVELDGSPAMKVKFHRSLFRAFTVLDHITDI